MKHKRILLIIILTIIVCISPWITNNSALSLVEKDVDFISRADVKRIPFGVIIEGDVTACPICPAFSKKTFFVSTLFTVHELK